MMRMHTREWRLRVAFILNGSMILGLIVIGLTALPRTNRRRRRLYSRCPVNRTFDHCGTPHEACVNGATQLRLRALDRTRGTCERGTRGRHLCRGRSS